MQAIAVRQYFAVQFIAVEQYIAMQSIAHGNGTCYDHIATR